MEFYSDLRNYVTHVYSILSLPVSPYQFSLFVLLFVFTFKGKGKIIPVQAVEALRVARG
jgi:hypothetical protein